MWVCVTVKFPIPPTPSLPLLLMTHLTSKPSARTIFHLPSILFAFCTYSFPIRFVCQRFVIGSDLREIYDGLSFEACSEGALQSRLIDMQFVLSCDVRCLTFYDPFPVKNDKHDILFSLTSIVITDCPPIDVCVCMYDLVCRPFLRLE